jgi:hypothetical protein
LVGIFASHFSIEGREIEDGSAMGRLWSAHMSNSSVSDRLLVSEELVILIVAADLRVVGHELDACDPLHLLEAELDLVAMP